MTINRQAFEAYLAPKQLKPVGMFENYLKTAWRFLLKDKVFSLRDEIIPFMIICDPNRGDLHNVIANVSSSDYKMPIGKIEAVWHKDLPAESYEYSFPYAEFQKQYQSEITFPTSLIPPPLWQS